MVTLPGAELVTAGVEEDDPPQPIITSENAVRAEMPSAFRSFELGLLIEPPRKGEWGREVIRDGEKPGKNKTRSTLEKNQNLVPGQCYFCRWEKFGTHCRCRNATIPNSLPLNHILDRAKIQGAL
jgi:hypothetical protein